jgi:hypothetical protein
MRSTKRHLSENQLTALRKAMFSLQNLKEL